MYNKIYIKHIYNTYIIRFTYVTLVFSSLVFILNVLEELKFFSNYDDVGIGLPVLLTILNFPSVLFEIFIGEGGTSKLFLGTRNGPRSKIIFEKEVSTFEHKPILSRNLPLDRVMSSFGPIPPSLQN